MSSLYSINRRLANIDHSLSMAHNRMNEKAEQLGRMRAAKDDLAAVQSEFLSEKSQCTEPEFASNTFYGEQANKIDNFRINHVEESFQAIANDQMTEVLSQMLEEINRLNDEVIALNNTITSLNNSRSTLLAQRESELMRNG